MTEGVRYRASRYTRLLWDEWLMDPADFKYNLGFISRISGPVDVQHLRAAILCFVNQNPVIRSSFIEENDVLYQILNATIPDPVEYYDYTGRERHHVDSLITRLSRHAFTLTEAPLFRFAIIKAGENDFHVALIFHHTVIDGTSARLVPDEVSRLYESESLDLSNVVHDSPSLKSYIEYEEAFFTEHPFDEGLEYWESALGQRDLYINLPKKERLPDEPGFSPRVVPFELDEKLVIRVYDYVQKAGCTVFHLMAALWSIFVKKLSGSEEIPLLYPVSLRPKHMPDLEGYLVNSLPMLVDFTAQSTLNSTVNAIREQRKHSRPFQHVPFDLIAARYSRTSAVKYGKRSGNYLNVTAVEADTTFSTPVDLKGLPSAAIPFQTLGNSELHMIFRRGSNFLCGNICYDDSILDSSVFDSSPGHLALLLERLLDSPGAEIDSVSFLSDREESRIVYEWNSTESPWPENTTIQQLFEEQAAKTPDNRAVVFEGSTLTYRELNERANQLAHTIRREYRELCGEDLKSDSLIGLYIERGMDMITAILGILKSGAAYVPFDLADPEDRLKFKVNDCGCRMIITTSGSLEALVFLAETDTMPLSMDSYLGEIEKASKENPASINSPGDLAYVIYTSGSTGRPKGVMTRHDGVVNFISYHRDRFRTTRAFDNVIQSISINFDASWTELALSLFRGSTLHVIRYIARLSGDELAGFIAGNEISIFVSTPALTANLPRKSIEGLQCIISGGDVGDQAMMDFWSDRVQYFNAYGPTEATICTTYSRHDRTRSNRNIGSLLSNKKAYILDSRMTPVPQGVYGELYIGGDGLAKGYLHRPELTAERFIDNPFATEEERRGRRNLKLYRTGDMVRWISDGTIEFHQRNDDQVKMNGFRIELGEIENRLAEYPSVTSCAVLCRERGGGKYLAAWFTAGSRVDTDDLGSHLSKLLPYYMVPSFFTQLDEMPYTVNGKIDRKVLPEPSWKGDKQHYTAPRNDIEEMLCRIWAAELGIEKIGITEDFFSMGGNSIMAIKLSHRMTEALGREIPVASIFSLKTVKSFSDELPGFRRQVNIEPCGGDMAVLSFAQERLYFIEEYEGGSSAYNIPFLYELDGDTDIGALKKAIDSIVMRHEVLRTVFVKSDSGDIHQKVRAELPVITERKLAESVFDSSVAEDINTVFDLHAGHPFRAVLYRTEEKCRILFNVHHIAFDGWSADIFLSELEQFYRHHRDGSSVTLPRLEIQYRDFAVWQREYLSGERLALELDYWRKALADSRTFEFPVDLPRPAEVQYGGDCLAFELDSGLSERLRAAVREYNTTPYSLFLAAFYILLYRYSGQDDIVIGTPTANRQYRQLENLIGFFVNSTVMRCTFTPDLDIRGLIGQTAAAQAAMQMHQDLPFEKLVELLQVEKDPSRHPIFQIMFGVQSFGSLERAEMPRFLKSVDISRWYTTAKFDLSLVLDDSQQRISGNITWATSLFEKARIEQLAAHYKDILRQIASGENRLIKDMPLLSSAERDMIIRDWNATEAPYPCESTIAEIFEAQAENNPDLTALMFENESLTYRDLNERANRLANTLRRDYRELTGAEIRGDTLIGIYMERSVDMIVAILGILKSGAAYVPFDRADPPARLRFKINDCGARMTITSSRCIGDLLFLTEKETLPLSLDEYNDELENAPCSNPDRVSGPRNLAYVIYTSGSTGTPKGVMIEHYGVVNLAFSHRKSLDITGDSRILHFAPSSFDASVSTLFCALLNGAALCMCTEEMRKDAAKLSAFIAGSKISHIDIPARLLEILPKDLDCSSLRSIITAGEVCDSRTMEYWGARVKLINAYGPTESTVCATIAAFSQGRSNVNIGKPISNKKVYVLDGNLSPVLPGVPGELYIGGDGLARCYLGRPELTAERFIENPFLSESDRMAERRMYRTGDVVRWSRDGDLEFIGRNDDMVKIRGYRIELAEVEHRLSACPGIAMCAVTVYRRDDDRYLCACYTVSGKTPEDEIRAYLATVLPEYMIPSFYLELEALPLSASGKVDRKALPAPDRKGGRDSYAAPRNGTEEELCRLWQEILGVDRIGIEDDFFRSGGNSILAIKAAHRMRDIVGHDIAVSELFKNRTISGFSATGSLETVEMEGEVVEL